MPSKPFIVDADAHILEPVDLWEKNLEPEYRDRAIRFKKDENGLEYMEVDGKKSLHIEGGVLGSFSGNGDLDLVKRYFTPGEVTFEEATPPGANDPHERIKVMDEEGIHAVVPYPSIGITWEDECEDPKLAAAYCRAYNNWMLDFAKPYPERIVPIAMISVKDVQEGVKELKRVAKLGFKGTYLVSRPANGVPYGEPYYDPYWAELQELDMPVGLHVNGGPNFTGQEWYPETQAQSGVSWWYSLMLSEDVQQAFTTFFQGGVFDRFPRLKVIVLESGCGWIAWWLERMDSVFRVNGRLGPRIYAPKIKLYPSEYFQRQCWISMEPDEKMAEANIRAVGADRFIWASDYPHSEATEHPLEEVKEALASLPEEDQRKVLGENARKLYRIP